MICGGDGGVEEDAAGETKGKSVSHTESELLWTSRGYPQPRSGRRGQRCVGPTGALGAHILHIIPSSSPTKRPPSLYYGVFRLPFDWPSLFLLIPSHPDQTRRSFIKPYSVPFGDRFVELEGVLFRPVFRTPSPIVHGHAGWNGISGSTNGSCGWEGIWEMGH